MIVLDWDTSSHPEAHQLWTQAILADGGSKCEAILAQSGEPLVEGMLVGKESDRLSIQQVEEVGTLLDSPWDFLCFGSRRDG